MADRRLVLTTDAEAFLREWESDSDTISAHTSGSTGTPKEIKLLKTDMIASARATIDFFGLDSHSCLWLPLSPAYIAGKMQIVRAVEAGCSLCVEPPSSRPLSGGTSGRISLLPVVPSQLEGVMSSPSRDRIDNIIVGGAPVTPGEERILAETGINAYATYGMTETCSHVALRKIGEECFNALPGFEFDTDARGCLVITSSTLSFGRLVTNDVVSLHSPASFRWLGRYDNVINSGGVKISPEEIERVLLPMLPHSVTAYVTSRRSDRWGEEAVVVTDSRSVARSLLDRLGEHLPPYHCPKDVIYVPEIRRTPVSGKIIREKF